MPRTILPSAGQFFFPKKIINKSCTLSFCPKNEGKELWYIISISTLVVYKAQLPYIGPECGGYKNKKTEEQCGLNPAYIDISFAYTVDKSMCSTLGEKNFFYTYLQNQIKRLHKKSL
jgi:hypothetical protein